MYLKTVRMRGFKSFAQNVELSFDQGIAVVVGPNGSGKSNIADALQWAMAVQSPAQLRAPTGQDVLFGGSDVRQAAGVCEVELVLDNECGTLPIEFNEVSVMRRLYRDGESEYYLNRAKVRRLDVMELLSDTGLGREMHSVIGQGKVEEILLSKPHERRRFVEEAAGLGKYQRRRHPGRGQAVPCRGRAGARPRPRARGARPAAAAVDAGHRRRAGGEAGRRDRAGADGAAVVGAAGRAACGSTTCAAGWAAPWQARPRSSRRRRRSLRAATGRRASWPGCRPSRSGRPAPSMPTSRRASGSWPRRGGWRHRWRGWSAAPGGAGSRPRSCAGWPRARRMTRVAADASAVELESEAAGIGQGDVQAAEDAAAQAEAALSSALGARRAHADAEGQAANVRRELEAATARAAELTERHVALNAQSAATTEQLHEADAEATTLAGRLEAARAWRWSRRRAARKRWRPTSRPPARPTGARAPRPPPRPTPSSWPEPACRRWKRRCSAARACPRRRGRSRRAAHGWWWRAWRRLPGSSGRSRPRWAGGRARSWPSGSTTPSA